MAGTKKPVEAGTIACRACQKEIPRSEAVVPEAVDYLIYFCGLDCLEQWKQQDRRQESEDIRRAVDDGMQDLRVKKG